MIWILLWAVTIIIQKPYPYPVGFKSIAQYDCKAARIIRKQLQTKY